MATKEYALGVLDQNGTAGRLMNARWPTPLHSASCWGATKMMKGGGC